MANGVRRSVKQGQIDIRVMDIQVNGTLATPTVTGIDKSNIASITDIGAGNYTVIFKRSYAKAPQVMCQSLTADIDIQVTAVDVDRFTVQCNSATVATDADFYAHIIGSDYKRYL